MSSVSRGNWNSRFGFILAAAGSAIGLGNIWRFPYTAGEYGGGAFVLLYLVFVFVIGLPVLLAELSVGRATQRSPVGGVQEAHAGKPVVVAGWIGCSNRFRHPVVLQRHRWCHCGLYLFVAHRAICLRCGRQRRVRGFYRQRTTDDRLGRDVHAADRGHRGNGASVGESSRLPKC